MSSIRSYSPPEYADMHYVYEFCDGNAKAVRTEYRA